MGEEARNKDVIRALTAALNSGDADAFADLHDPQGVNHAPAPFDLTDWPAAGKPYGPAEARATLIWGRTMTPDLHIELEHLIAEGDQVVAWGRMTGTSSGPSPSGNAPRPVDFRHAQRFRLRDGRIVEHWAIRDDLRGMIQSGLVTPPGPPKG